MYICETELDGRVSGVLWMTMFTSLAAAVTFSRRSTCFTFIISAIIRSILSIGLEPTLTVLGVLNVSHHSAELMLMCGFFVLIICCNICLFFNFSTDFVYFVITAVVVHLDHLVYVVNLLFMSLYELYVMVFLLFERCYKTSASVA